MRITTVIMRCHQTLKQNIVERSRYIFESIKLQIGNKGYVTHLLQNGKEMYSMSISCKNCSSRVIVKNGQARGKQCYRCQNCAYNLYQEPGVLSQKQLLQDVCPRWKVKNIQEFQRLTSRNLVGYTYKVQKPIEILVEALIHRPVCPTDVSRPVWMASLSAGNRCGFSTSIPVNSTSIDRSSLNACSGEMKL